MSRSNFLLGTIIRFVSFRNDIPTLPLCCKLHDFRSRSDTSAMARLTSDEELQESSCAEFLREARAASVECGIVTWPPLSQTCRVWSADAVLPEVTAFADPCSVLGPGTASHGHTSSIGRTVPSVAPASLTTGTLLYDLVFTVCFGQGTTRFTRARVCVCVCVCERMDGRVYVSVCARAFYTRVSFRRSRCMHETPFNDQGISDMYTRVSELSSER